MGVEKLLAVVEKSYQDPNAVLSLSVLSQAIHDIICSEQAFEYRINGCYAELKLLVEEIKAIARKRLSNNVFVSDLTQYKLRERTLLHKLRELADGGGAPR